MSAPPDHPTDPIAAAGAAATEAARAARDASGLANEGWERPQRHAFAALLFGLASALASRHGAAADQAPDLAVELLRDTMRLSFREASATVDAIVDALTADPPHPTVRAMVQFGWMAANAWSQGDRTGFEARVLQATASDAFASDRPLMR